KDLKQVIGHINFPPFISLPAGALTVVVVVVPAFAESDDGEQEIVSAVVRGFKPPRAENMGERIYRIGCLVQADNGKQVSPCKGRQAAQSKNKNGKKQCGYPMVFIQETQLGELAEIGYLFWII